MSFSLNFLIPVRARILSERRATNENDRLKMGAYVLEENWA